ncbi:MAG: hypothetical protein WB564_09725 [Dehalococcoidia bacterium]
MERAHLTYTEEFCEGTDSSFNAAELKDKLHQSLGYLTTVEYIEKEFAKIRSPVLPMWSASTTY